ncbi:MAG: GGDEF domain-containing protein [Cellulomonadaceae bacterium]|nr:GGDEF domain-containing protein [Cellulomonadaceae bacterium]
MPPSSSIRGAVLRPETRGWVLAFLLAAGGVVCLLLTRSPLTAGSRDAAIPVVGVLLLALAVPAALLRRRATGLWAVVMVALALVTVLLAGSATVAGLMLASTSYTYVVLYAAYAFTRRRLLTVLVAVVASSLAGAGLSGPGILPIVWVSTVGGMVVAGVVLGHLVRLLRWYATTDALTGVLTRTAFDATARSALAGVRRRSSTAVLVLIDLDDFKAVNDTHGHAAGDAVLSGTVGAWRERLRDQDVLGRSGGDEFVLLLPDTDLPGADRLVSDLARACDVGFSAGFALARPTDSLDDLLARADAEMYDAKRGRSDASDVPVSPDGS